MPISEAVYVACAGTAFREGVDVVHNGAMHAIAGDSMAQGRCFLYVDPCNLNSRTPPKIQKGLELSETAEDRARADELATTDVQRKHLTYGPQNLLITVTRQGVSGKWEGLWTVEPSTWTCNRWADNGLPKPASLTYRPVASLALAVPQANQEGGDTPYSVHVQGAALAPNVAYLDGTVAPGTGGVQPLSPENQFDVRLRPPGLFGFPYSHGGMNTGRSVRMFVTIPVDGVALRTPASLRDLRSSSDNTGIQIATLRSGVLLTVEPWDYNKGANFFAVPLRFQIGMHLIDLGKGSFTPSFLVGASAAIPLVESQSKFTQTSVGIGLFYENDLRDQSSHALLTVGLNLLSLFSPSAGQAH
jgi:hypothetical protein